MNIITEIGLNHLGSTEIALEMLDSLIAEPEIDGITFQIREEVFYDSTAPHKKKLPLSFYRTASEKVRRAGKLFGIAIADAEIIDDLHLIGVDFWKTLSWDIGNQSLFQKLKRISDKIYVSTGISSTEEIVQCSKNWEDVVFIHTNLSSDVNNVSLASMLHLRDSYGIEMAFGLHSDFKEVLFIAASLHPSDVFFYVKSSNDAPDGKHGFHLSEVAETCLKVRHSTKVMGSSYKDAILTPDWVEKK